MSFLVRLQFKHWFLVLLLISAIVGMIDIWLYVRLAGTLVVVFIGSGILTLPFWWGTFEETMRQ